MQHGMHCNKLKGQFMNLHNSIQYQYQLNLEKEIKCKIREKKKNEFHFRKPWLSFKHQPHKMSSALLIIFLPV